MSSMETIRRRPRRIASDEAHAWARNLRLGNPHAKFVLCMLTGYVNGEGACFVSIAALADDCELVENTVRRRLAFLEEVGAIARAPQWIDDLGRRNNDGRGRRTTDEIRLMLDSDEEEIEARACGNGDHGREAESDPDPASGEAPTPAPHEGLNSPGGALGVHLPFTCVQGLISEPEPKILPPSPPPGGGEAEERFQEFKAGYPDGILDPASARAEFGQLSPADQKAAIAALPVYAARCRRRNNEKSMKAHLFVRKRAWEGLLAAPATEARGGGPYDPASEAGRALIALSRAARTTLPRLGDGRLIYVRPITPQLLALAAAPATGAAYQKGTPNFFAWRDFLRAHLTNLPRLDEIEAPWPWPPRKDGAISSVQDSPKLASEEELNEFADSA